MKNVYFNSNDSLVTVASPNQTSETLPRDYRKGTINSLCRNLTLLFAILTMSLANIGMAWGDTLTETHNGSAAGDLYYTRIQTTSGSITYKSNSSAINVAQNTSASFTIASVDGSNISSITFTQNGSYPIGSLSSSDGSITTTSNTYTFTPTTQKSSYSFTLAAQTSKNCRVVSVVITLTSECEFFTRNFAYTGSANPFTITSTKSNASSDIMMTANNNSSLISSNNLQLGSGKQLTISSSGHNIKSVHFICVSYETMSNLSANTGTYSSNHWSADANTQTVTFTSSGSNANITGIRVELVEIGETHTVTAATNNASYGTAAAAKTTVAEGATTTITATPKSGYAFDHWTVSGTGASLSSTTTNPTTLTMGTSDVTVTAYFGEACDIQIYSLTDEIGSAVVTASDATVTAGTSLVMSNTSGRIKLTPASGKFKNGDKVEFGGTIGNTSKKYGLKIYASDGSSAGDIYVNGTTDPLKASGTLSLASDQDYIFIARYDGTTTTLTSCEITRVSTCPEPPSCTAPNHVDISGNYHFFPGETLVLTATAYSTAGTGSPIAAGDITGYQWQKYIGSDWENIVGETSSTYTKANATTSDVGQYRCIVSTGATCSTTSGTFNVKCLQLYVYWDNNSDKCNLPLTKVDGSNATALVFLENSSYTYHFKITDGCGNWYGNDGTMTSSNCTGWNMDKNSYCGLTTSKAATYTFNVNYSNLALPQVSVVYPASDQTAGYDLYFANDGRNWAADKIYYRIGKSTHNNKYQMTKVYGTANLFHITTSTYGGFEAWHIANNGGWSDGNSIYKTKDLGDWTITNATRFEGAPVPSGGWTIIPGSDHSTGSSSENNNCEFYSFTTVPGMWTHNVAITAPSHGTLTVNYTTTANESTAFSSGNRDLAHTANYCVTAEEGVGYTVASITINGTPVANRSWHVLTEDVVVAATFTLADYTITHSAASNGTYTIKVGDAAAVSTNTTANYGQTVTLAASPGEGYELSSWTVTKAGGGTVDVVSNQFTMPNENVTITATFALKTYTITYNAGTGDGITGSHANDTKTHGVNLTLPGVTFNRTGYTQTGWATSDGGSQAYALSASYTANTAANLYPVWTAKTTTITINANTVNHGSTTPGTVTATYGSALPSFTAAVGASGWELIGYYTAATDGTKIINADGTLVRNTTYSTDESTPKWNSEVATLTLFAQYEEELPSKCVTPNSSWLATYESAKGAGSYALLDGVKYDLEYITDDASGMTMGWIDDHDTYVHVSVGNLGVIREVQITIANVNSTPGDPSQKYGFIGEFFNENEFAAHEIDWDGSNFVQTTSVSNGETVSFRPTSGSNNSFIFQNFWSELKISHICIYYESICSAPTSAIISGGGAKLQHEAVELTASATGTDASTTYTWYRSNSGEAAAIAAGAIQATKTAAAGGNSYSIADCAPEDAFVYYCVISNGAGCNVTASTSISVTAAYILTYDANAGGDAVSNLPEPEVHTPGTYTLSSSVPTRAGYTFDCWNRNAAGTGDCFAAGASFTTGALNETLYAKWTEDVVGFTVTYKYNGATDGASPASETAASVTLPTPTRTGYELQGWYTTAGIKAGDGGDTYNPTANITLYAKWYATCSAGSGIEWDFTSMSERSFTTSNTGTGGNVNEISSTTGTGTLYYYAGSSCAITEKSSTMCLALGGGSSSGTVNDITTYQNRCFYIDIASNGTLLIHHNSSANNAPSYQITSATRPGTSGYTSQSAVGTGDDAYNYQISVSTYNASTACRIWIIYPNKSYIEKITWTPAGASGTCYHVTYDGNGATSGFVNDTTAYKSGDEVTVLGNDGRYPYVNGLYEIKGWADSDAKADAGTVDYAPGATFTITADKTLYAVWSNTYDITYNLNGASWAEGYSATESYSYGMAVVTLPEAADMSNPGYTFNGWYANSDLSTGGVVTTIGTSEYGAKEFWAKWTENTYTVTYNANGGTGSMETTVGRYVNLRENTFTYDGHIFMGWNTAANGSGISYNDEDEVELTADMTLYAQWGADLTATWSVTNVDDKLYRGGGGYSVTVYLNQADWDASGDVNALELTAMEGVVLSNITKTVNIEGKAQVTANFGITTGVAADATAITFTLSVPAAGTYASAELTDDEDLDECVGGGGSTISIFDGTTATEKTDVDGTSYKEGVEHTDPQTGFKYTCKGVKKDLYTNSMSNSTGNGKTYSAGLRMGGNSSSSDNYIQLKVPTGYTANLYIVSGGGGGGSTLGVSKTAGTSTSYHEYANRTISSSGSYYLDEVTNLAAGTYYILGSSDKLVFGEITVTLTSAAGEGGVATTLSWETDLSAGENKETGDADFTHTASTTSNTLGAITYSSSNTSVATVNADGKVHIVGAEGDATITATLAASGCFEQATATYTIHVVDNCIDEPGTITSRDLGCDGTELTVSGHTATASVSYQWYKDGVTMGSGYTNPTCTVTVAGEYYVVVDNSAAEGDHCAMASTNTIKVTAKAAATATKIVDSWYVKNGRRTPDVELVQTTNANGFIVKIGETKIWDSDGSVTTGFGGCGFHMDENGIIYLNGTTAADGSGNAASGLTGGEDETLTITVSGCGGDPVELEITIHCQAATERKSVAFVVDGTEKGTFDEPSADHSTNSPLYQFLDYGADESGAFDLTAQNIYSSVDEKEIREHFSQFDAILITDDPNTGKTKDSKSYVNAFGTMIDVRPILSMEAYVSKLSNWKDKGVSGTPSSPNPRQYEMRLQCKDHEIYAGLPTPAPGTHVWAEFIDGDEYRHVIMVDSTKSPYAGVAYNEQTAGDKKPALQGFESEDMGNLLGLGLILNGTLHAGVERQEEPAARMMLLGIQNKALPNALTEEGKKVIENALTYLLKTNMEEVDDCSNFFKGGDSSKPKDWNTLANWSKATFPNYETKVRILAPCEVSGIQVRVAQVDIATSGTSSKIPSGTCSGSLTIKEDGALIVGGKVRTAEAPRFGVNELKPTTASDLKVCSSSSGTGALIFDNSDGKAQATVEMWNPSHWETVAGKKKKYWSYVGVPITNVEIPDYFYLGFTYLYDETSGWIKKWDGDVLQPFEGIGLSMQSGNKETFYGTLASTATKEITLTKTAEGGNGENLIGNSWTAPIQIANFKTADFGEATATVYVYNTGRDEQASGETGEASYGDNNSATAGQWVSVPVSAAKLDGYTGLKVIPAMNAFQVNTSSETTLTLDYDTLVRKDAASNEGINSPMRAPRRAASKAIDALMRVRVSGEKTHTDVWLLQDEQFSDDFDNGWEAIYAVCDNRSAQLYAVSELGQMAFIAKPDLDGTLLGFAPSRDGHEYTFSFQYTGDEALYLNDMQEETSTLINEENTYMFTYSENDMTGRFIISAQPFGIPAVITGNESINTDAKPIKFIRENKMYILVNGILYDATGKIVVR